jgi:DNA-3-methyladenine glycosylase I
MSKALRGLGYGFVGPTTMYALMQSAGMVDDHVRGCWKAVPV